MSRRIEVDPQQVFAEFGDLSRKMLEGSQLLQKTKGADVEIATTPKNEVFRQDKTVLYHYEPLTGVKVKIPVLIVFGLVGRYTFIDLQEDRSLTRNLLMQGIDLYVVDWGTPTRGDRWLTMEDYIDGYLDDCVEYICRAAQNTRDHAARHLRGRHLLRCVTQPASRSAYAI